jgi:hypothetical protein
MWVVLMCVSVVWFCWVKQLAVTRAAVEFDELLVLLLHMLHSLLSLYLLGAVASIPHVKVASLGYYLIMPFPHLA